MVPKFQHDCHDSDIQTQAQPSVMLPIFLPGAWGQVEASSNTTTSAAGGPKSQAPLASSPGLPRSSQSRVMGGQFQKMMRACMGRSATILHAEGAKAIRHVVEFWVP